MKKGLIIFVLILTMTVIPTSARADESLKVFIDGRQLNFDVQPVIVEGRVLVPLEVLGSFSLTPVWMQDQQAVMIQNGLENYSWAAVGNPVAIIRDTEVELDIPPIMINDRVMVPLKFIAGVACCAVNYDPAIKTISITTTGSTGNVQLDSKAWVYYYDESNQTICRQRPDGSEKAGFRQEGWLHSSRLRVVDGSLYVYIDGFNEVYRVKDMNHPQREGLGIYTDCYDVKGDDVFYIVKVKDGGLEENKLIKRNIKTGQTKVIADRKVVDHSVFNPYGSPKVVGDWIYFLRDGMEKVKTDGSSNKKLTAEIPQSFEIRDGNIVCFYYNQVPKYQVLDLDGNIIFNDIEFDQFHKTGFLVSGGWIYYFSPYYNNGIPRGNGESISRMKLDGSNESVVSADKCCGLQFKENFVVKNGWLYYKIMDSNEALYAIKTDGSCKTKITNNSVGYIAVD